MINNTEQIHERFNRCAASLDFLNKLTSIPGQTRCYLKEDFTLSKEPVSDREILQRVTALAESVLAHREYVPAQDMLEKLRNGVQAFIEHSTELSPEEKEKGLETIYLTGALLKELLPGKCENIALLDQWKAMAKTSTGDMLLRRKVTYFDEDEIEHLRAVRNTMYCAHKLLSAVVQFEKQQLTYCREFWGFRDSSKLILVESDNPSEVFYVTSEFGDLFGAIDSLALRMRTEKILHSSEKIKESALLGHIQDLVDLKRRDPSKSAVVDNCLSVMRCMSLDGGEDKGVLGLDEALKEADYWHRAIMIGWHDERTKDRLLTNVMTVTRLAAHLLWTNVKLDAFFNEQKKVLFKDGQYDEVRKMICFQNEKRNFLWPMTEGIIHYVGAGLENDIVLYQQLHEKIGEFIQRLPKESRPMAMRSALNTLKITLDEEDRTFSDVSPKDYASLAKSIMAYDTPVVTAIDRLAQAATELVSDDKVSDLTSSIQSLSVNDGVQQKGRSTRQKGPKAKKRKQQKQQATTLRVAKESLSSTLSHPTEKVPLVTTSIVSPMILPSEGPWQTKALHLPKVAHSPFAYHGRVSRWFDPKQNPFIDDPAYAVQDLSDHAQAWIRVKHAFGLVVDQFAKQFGIVHEDEDAKTIALVGEISMNGETERGIFVWAFGKGKNADICHHRYFSKKTDNEIVDEYAQRGFYQLEMVPEEPHSHNLPPQKGGKNNKVFEDKSTVDYEKGSAYTIVINDPKNNDAVITICRLDS